MNNSPIGLVGTFIITLILIVIAFSLVGGFTKGVSSMLEKAAKVESR